jgi:hypothetical protein
MWAPPVGPVDQLLSGAGDGGPPQPEPASTGQHGAGGLACGGPLGVPAGEQRVADPICLCGGGDRTAALSLLSGVFGVGCRLPVARLQRLEPVGLVCLECDDGAEPVAQRLLDGKSVQAALLGRPRLLQPGQDLVDRREPTEATAPASARRWVYRMATY